MTDFRMSWKWKLAQAAEIKWWEHYLRSQAPEEYLASKRAYWSRIMQQAGVKMTARQHVLDAGCGPAGIFIALPECRIDALDPLLEEYERRLPHFRREWYPNVAFYNSTLENFQAVHPYDAIFCLNAINHVSDIGAALDRLVNALAPQGSLWLSVDAHRYRLLRWVFQQLPGDILHPHQYTLQEYEGLLHARGLEIQQVMRLKAGRIFDYYLLEARLSA